MDKAGVKNILDRIIVEIDFDSDGFKAEAFFYIKKLNDNTLEFNESVLRDIARKYIKTEVKFL